MENGRIPVVIYPVRTTTTLTGESGRKPMKEEKEEIIDVARNLQEQCEDYKRITERALGEKQNVEEEMRVLLNSQLRREEELDLVRKVFAKSSLF